MSVSCHLHSSQTISRPNVICTVALPQKSITLLISATTPPTAHKYQKISHWEPFSSCIDFDFAELVLKANLTKVQTNKLISLIHCTAFEQFSVTDYDGVLQFKKEVILVLHREQEHTFDVWYRLLWDWACYLLKDHHLGLHFVFDAQYLYKYDGQNFSSLPKDEGKPFAFIIYADKVKLSSFSHQKAYSVIMQYANLPIGICNGKGFGADSCRSKKIGNIPEFSPFVNVKNVVWHESFKHLLKSLAPLLKTGFWVKCWDGIESDYEEQCVMALICGTNCKCPCPVCLVPKEKLGNNSFSDIAHTDVHSVVLFDRLHVNNKGNFSDHLWTQFQECIKLVSRFDLMPCWQKLNHFNHIIDISFSDGSKYEDILKIIVFAAHDVINQTSKFHELPYLLLCCIHEYVNVNMYAALEVHTSKMIAAGCQAVRQFTQLLDQYSEKDNSGKNWAYLKRHAHAHLFDDFKAKGATHNTNTKPNEKCVLHLDHRFLIAHSIHLDIEDHNEIVASQKNRLLAGSKDNEDDLDGDPDDMFHVKLGAAQNEQTFEDLEQLHADDNAFKWFCIKLADFLSDSLPAHGIPLSNMKRIKFTPNVTVAEHRPMFGHLLMLFICIVDDKHFQFWHVHKRPRISSEFFSVRSIIHGAALTEDHNVPGDYLVIDTIDTDMFLHMKN
ncbi:hypothetical protein BDR06DRAFT_980503 [Suillus hirtellus]|nr:hypothetical protein BDR06DRAFT_980503 [Suillus hirtellus]